jgi:ubiquinone/menaquinone biosynthesis C-methylase UbiE
VDPDLSEILVDDSVTPWQMMQPYEAKRWGQDIFDEQKRHNWCSAIITGGLPYLWRKVARVPREVMFDKMELREGDKVIILGEAIEGCMFDREVEERVGPSGEVVVVDFMNEARDRIPGGRPGAWDWDYTQGYEDEHFDMVAVLQGVAHAADWRATAEELLRVMKPGRRIVMGEIAFGPPFADRIATDVHIQYIFDKLYEGHRRPFQEMPYTGPAELMEAFDGLVDEPEAFDWRGVELFWGRKPS